MADLTEFSRFLATDEVQFSGVVTVGRWRQPSWLLERPPENLIQRYLVTSGTEGRPHAIANEVYGTPELDWVIVAFNQVVAVLNWPRAGDLIEYPNETLVFSELF